MADKGHGRGRWESSSAPFVYYWCLNDKNTNFITCFSYHVVVQHNVRFLCFGACILRGVSHPAARGKRLVAFEEALVVLRDAVGHHCRYMVQCVSSEQPSSAACRVGTQSLLLGTSSGLGSGQPTCRRHMHRGT